MPIRVRRSDERGAADHGWLKSKFTFSFAEYYDPRFESFGALRVINDDTVAAGGGFSTHGHRDMDIFSYVLSGALAHTDSMKHNETIARGQVQFTSAGTGITHAEFNNDKSRTGAPVRFLQCWVSPRKRGLTPSYQTGSFPDAAKRDTLLQFIGPAPVDAEGLPPRDTTSPILINADFSAYASLLSPAAVVTHAVTPARRAYVHVPILPGCGGLLLSHATDGSAAPVMLAPGDGAFIEGIDMLRIEGAGGTGVSATEFVLFDLA